MNFKESIKEVNIVKTITYVILNLLIFTSIDLIYSLINKNYQYGMTIFFPIAFIAIALIPKPKLRFVIYIFMLFMSFIQLVHFEYFGSLLRAIEIYMLFISINDVNESFMSSLNILITPSILISVALALLYIVHRKFKEIQMSFNHSGKVILLLIVIFMLNDVRIVYRTSNKLYSKSSKMLYPIAGNSSTFNYFKTLNYFLIGILPKKMMGNNSHFEPLEEPKLVTKDPNIDVIFVIGETLRAKNVSFLGYKKNHTTPLLEKLFKEEPTRTFGSQIYSGGTMSKTSIAVLVNRLKYPGTTEQIVKKDNCIFKLAKDNNFNTAFASSQEKQYLSIVHTLICKRSLDTNISRADINKMIKNPVKQDGDLIPLIGKLLKKDKSNLIALQMLGSHSPYELRYPKKWDKFKSTFDNTILYTDYVLSEIINNALKNTEKTTYVVYASDHGELLNEKGQNGHGWFEPEVYEVPFVFASNKPIPESLRQDLNNISSHFDVSNLLAKLLGYDTKIESMKEKTIYVNGSDLDALGGFLRFDFKDGKQVSMQKQN